MKKLPFLLAAALALLLVPAPALCEEAPAARDIVYTIPIRGMIEPALLYVIRRGLSEADACKAKAIVFVMDTPGGTVSAATEIVHAIQKVDVPTYTFVEHSAFSAGAIIALATEHIYMAPGTVIGDAMPIMMTPVGGVQEMPDDLKEKAVSGVAALVRSAAETGGHNKELAEKMVRRELELKMDGELISPKGQLLTLTNTEAERKIGRAKQPILSEGTVADVNGLLKHIGLQGAEIRELQVTAVERIARFIAAFAPLFLMGGLLGIYIEIKTPGVVLPGILGVICLIIFFWGHHIAGLAGMEDILLFLAGLVLLIVELLFIPGFGVIGFAGIALMLWALLDAMIVPMPDGSWLPSWSDIEAPVFKLSIALVGSVATALMVGRFLPKSRTFNRLVLQKAIRREEGFAATRESSSLIGLEGRALSQLRPAGSALFGDRKLDVVTRGDFIPGGEPIRIVETHGSRIIVEAIKKGIGG